MGDKHMRMHHRVEWDCCTPKILNQRWKKIRKGVKRWQELVDRKSH